MEAALIAQLLDTPAFVAVVGQRMSWDRRPQGEANPGLVLHLIDAPRDYHLQGPSGLVAARVQADLWGDTKATAKAAAKALEAAVSGARFTRDGVRFDGILIDSERSDSFQEDGAPLFRTSLDLMVHFASA